MPGIRSATCFLAGVAHAGMAISHLLTPRTSMSPARKPAPQWIEFAPPPFGFPPRWNCVGGKAHDPGCGEMLPFEWRVGKGRRDREYKCPGVSSTPLSCFCWHPVVLVAYALLLLLLFLVLDYFFELIRNIGALSVFTCVVRRTEILAARTSVFLLPLSFILLGSLVFFSYSEKDVKELGGNAVAVLRTYPFIRELTIFLFLCGALL